MTRTLLMRGDSAYIFQEFYGTGNRLVPYSALTHVGSVATLSVTPLVHADNRNDDCDIKALIPA